MTILRQFAPLFFIIFMSLISSLGESAQATRGSAVRDYKFSFQQSYSFPHRLQTQNLGQPYFVNEYALYDFRQQNNRKLRVSTN